MVSMKEVLPDEFLRAYDKSYRKHRNTTLKLVEECDDDGKPCPFLRALKGRGYLNDIVAYYCSFDHCVRLYPTLKQLFHESKECVESE